MEPKDESGAQGGSAQARKGTLGDEDMNGEQLTQNVGQQVKLRPRVLLVNRGAPDVSETGIVVLTSGTPLRRTRTDETDYMWTIESVSNDKMVTLHCSFTGHTVTLGMDNMREFRTPGVLMLKCQLTLDGDKVLIEPF
jgi:hypothetical protein